mgnify:CR=1 FL=1
MHYMNYISGGVFASPFAGFGIFIAIIALWSLAWKGWALWVAARNQHTWWFVALLIINTAGILDIIYIFAIAKKSFPTVGGSSAVGK